MDTNKINAAVSRWTDPNRRPLFKGSLIDNDGCCCAQGDILRYECALSDEELRSMQQGDADAMVSKELGISRFHAVLLRLVNDLKDGCPQDVLTNPENVLGKYAQQCLALGRHIDAMTPEQWDAARTAARDAAWDAARDAARDAAWDAAWAAAMDAAMGAAWDAAWDAVGAMNEIQGQDVMREKGQPFYFLPMFGFNDPSEIPTNK